MKTVDELALAVIARVRTISPNTKISDSDISVITGVALALMTDDLVNLESKAKGLGGNFDVVKLLNDVFDWMNSSSFSQGLTRSMIQRRIRDGIESLSVKQY